MAGIRYGGPVNTWPDAAQWQREADYEADRAVRLWAAAAWILDRFHRSEVEAQAREAMRLAALFRGYAAAQRQECAAAGAAGGQTDGA
jgi:hypothetical protein